MLYDEGQPIAEPCPECQSRHTIFDPVFGFWKCEDCSMVWGDDQDDPDYEDLEPTEPFTLPTNHQVNRLDG